MLLRGHQMTAGGLQLSGLQLAFVRKKILIFSRNLLLLGSHKAVATLSVGSHVGNINDAFRRHQNDFAFRRCETLWRCFFDR